MHFDSHGLQGLIVRGLVNRPAGGFITSNINPTTMSVIIITTGADGCPGLIITTGADGCPGLITTTGADGCPGLIHRHHNRHHFNNQ